MSENGTILAQDQQTGATDCGVYRGKESLVLTFGVESLIDLEQFCSVWNLNFHTKIESKPCH